MKIAIQHTNHSFSRHLQYVLEFISGHPNTGGKLEFGATGSSDYDLLIGYGVEGKGNYFIPAQQMFFSQTIHRTGNLSSNTYGWKEMTLYGVEGLKKGTSEFLDGNRFGFDIFETIFYHISRYEEYFAPENELNGMGMLNNELLFLPIHGLEKIPVVDHIIYAFCQCLNIVIDPPKTEYILTHDIDKIYKYNSFLEGIKSTLWPVYFKKNIIWAARNLKRYLNVVTGKARDPYDTYGFLFRDSKAWTEKYVFFMAGGKTRYDLYGKHYIRDFAEVWEKARAKGYIAGLHPSFDTADDPEMLMAERTNLEVAAGQAITVARQHFLHYLPGRTDRHIESIRFHMDSTLGYTRLIGFRCGTGYRYRLFDFTTNQAFAFWELPLVVMDSSLIHETHDDIERFESALYDFVLANRHLTSICFNFHNSTFDNTLRSRRRLRAFYEGLEQLIEDL